MWVLLLLQPLLLLVVFDCFCFLGMQLFPPYFDLLGKIRDFLIWIKDNLLRERPELFIQNDSVWVIESINPKMCILMSADGDWSVFVIFFFGFHCSIFLYLFIYFLFNFVQATRNFGANQWNRLGTFGMNGNVFTLFFFSSWCSFFF